MHRVGGVSWCWPERPLFQLGELWSSSRWNSFMEFRDFTLTFNNIPIPFTNVLQTSELKSFLLKRKYIIYEEKTWFPFLCRFIDISDIFKSHTYSQSFRNIKLYIFHRRSKTLIIKLSLLSSMNIEHWIFFKTFILSKVYIV